MARFLSFVNRICSPLSLNLAHLRASTMASVGSVIQVFAACVYARTLVGAEFMADLNAAQVSSMLASYVRSDCRCDNTEIGSIHRCGICQLWLYFEDHQWP